MTSIGEIKEVDDLDVSYFDRVLRIAVDVANLSISWNKLYIQINRCDTDEFAGKTRHLPTTLLDSLFKCRSDVRLFFGGKILTNVNELPNDCTVTAHVLVCGGKGGFGSLLRAFGKQILISSNKEACRDLNGRRMRDVTNEKKLKEWLLKKAENKSLQEDKLERLKRKRRASPKHFFHDRKYQRQKEAIECELQDALDDAFNLLQRKLCEDKSSIEGDSDTVTRLMGIPEVESDDEDEIICISQELYDKLKGMWYYLDISKPHFSTSPYSSYYIHIRDEETANECEIIFPIKDCPTNQTNQSEMLFVQDGKKITLEESISNDAQSIDEMEPNLTECSKSVLETEFTDQAACDNIESLTSTDKLISAATLSTQKTIDLDSLTCLQNCMDLGPERLKYELMQRGLKCGGTLNERANRLWAVRGLREYPKRLLAKVRKESTLQSQKV